MDLVKDREEPQSGGSPCSFNVWKPANKSNHIRVIIWNKWTFSSTQIPETLSVYDPDNNEDEPLNNIDEPRSVRILRLSRSFLQGGGL